MVVNGKRYQYISMRKMQSAGYGIERLPYSLRIIVESVIRNYDGRAIRDEHIKSILGWNNGKPDVDEIPFKPARVLMHDLGFGNLLDFAAMRDRIKELGYNPKIIQTKVPVDLVIDHSLQVDYYGTEYAFKLNLAKQFERNRDQYEFMKWASQAFPGLNIRPPSIGIVHQVNLEYLVKCVMVSKGRRPMLYPDTVVGLDSHTAMINGLGVVGWGIGGIDGEAAILGEPVMMAVPDVVAVNLHGRIPPGVSATDVVIVLT